MKNTAIGFNDFALGVKGLVPYGGRTMPDIRNSNDASLAGIRILELTNVVAGPFCGAILADLGAEVIKVEALNRYDPGRGPKTVKEGSNEANSYPGGVPGEQPYNRNSGFNGTNRNKLGITLDFKPPKGRELFERLVRISNLVLENFSAGTMDRLGFGYNDLKKLRPDIILLSMSGFGQTGPESHYKGYGPTQDAMSGLTSIHGYPGTPMLTGMNYGDYIGATWGALLAVAGLMHQQRTGKGLFIDLSQREAMTTLFPELLLEYEMNGRIPGPVGNESSTMGPHGVYPCKEPDTWISIAVQTDQQWRSLCEQMADDDLAHDARFTTQLLRIRNHTVLDQIIAGWTREHNHLDLMHRLQGAGIPALAVLNPLEVLQDPHMHARHVFQEMTHPETGKRTIITQPWLASDGRAPVRLPAPMLGQHNAQVLGGLLGLSDAELKQLEEDGLIGTVPTVSLSAGG